MWISRILGASVALVLMIVGLAAGGLAGVFAALVRVLLPLALIWFPEEFGGLTGIMVTRGHVTEESPGCFIAFMGWVLMGVAIFTFYMAFQSASFN
jgi:hypothetical protein